MDFLLLPCAISCIYVRFNLIRKILSKLRFLSSLGVILFLICGTVFGQTLENKKSVIVEKQSVLKPKGQKMPRLELPDSIRISRNDSLASDSIVEDETTGFDAEVEYTADGYITLIQNSSGNKIIMYDNAQVKYKDIDLKAAYIELNRDSNLVYAVGMPDSTGAIAGKPIFKPVSYTHLRAHETRHDLVCR